MTNVEIVTGIGNLVSFATRFGIPAAQTILEELDTDKEITVADIEGLADKYMAKDPEEYFKKPPADESASGSDGDPSPG